MVICPSEETTSFNLFSRHRFDTNSAADLFALCRVRIMFRLPVAMLVGDM